MEILLIVSTEYQEQYSALIPMLNECGHKCHISTTTNPIASTTYDLIIALNKTSLTQAKSYAEKLNIPLVYFFTSSTAERDYPENDSTISEVVLLKDSYLSIPPSLKPPSAVELDFLFTLFSKEEEKKSDNPSEVLIMLDSSLTDHRAFLKILPSINILVNINFTVIVPSDTLANIINSNITIISELTEDIVTQSSYVIANGKHVQTAIRYSKPCIVIGDRGYGGILNPNNFESQYLHYFQGRVGGELDEFIPLELIEYDLLFLQENAKSKQIKDSCAELVSTLKEKENQNIHKLNNLLKKAVNLYQEKKQDVENMCLQFSNDYEILSINEGFLIVKSGIRTMHSYIEENEFNIIKLFSEPRLVSDILKETEIQQASQYSKAEHIAFIQELLSERILVPATT